jgi:1-acyl-sn-glycerol-3-phosphate acyltransferase
MLRKFYSFCLKQAGWEFGGTFDPDMPKFIAIVAPHTSNFDFPLGIMVRSVMNMKGTKFLGKSQLFKFPFGYFFRKMGGYPVERSKNNNWVESAVNIFNEHDKFSISLAPEGTRGKVDRLKTGFYHIAKQANIPILMIGFDYGRKRVVFAEPFYPTDDIKADFKKIFTFFSGMLGKNPESGLDMAMYDRMETTF